MDTPAPRRAAPRRAPADGGVEGLPDETAAAAAESLQPGGREHGVFPLADLPPPNYSSPGERSALAEDDSHTAQRLLLGDALCCECASRLAQLRVALARGQAMLEQATPHSRDATAHPHEGSGAGGGDAADSDGDGLVCERGGQGAQEEKRGDKVEALLDKERGRMQRLRQLESQLERALHNQRRYVLGRCGLGHLADGLVHLEGMRRLAESSVCCRLRV